MSRNLFLIVAAALAAPLIWVMPASAQPTPPAPPTPSQECTQRLAALDTAVDKLNADLKAAADRVAEAEKALAAAIAAVPAIPGDAAAPRLAADSAAAVLQTEIDRVDKLTGGNLTITPPAVAPTAEAFAAQKKARLDALNKALTARQSLDAALKARGISQDRGGPLWNSLDAAAVAARAACRTEINVTATNNVVVVACPVCAGIGGPPRDTANVAPSRVPFPVDSDSTSRRQVTRVPVGAPDTGSR